MCVCIDAQFFLYRSGNTTSAEINQLIADIMTSKVNYSLVIELLYRSGNTTSAEINQLIADIMTSKVNYSLVIELIKQLITVHIMHHVCVGL